MCNGRSTLFVGALLSESCAKTPGVIESAHPLTPRDTVRRRGKCSRIPKAESRGATNSNQAITSSAQVSKVGGNMSEPFRDQKRGGRGARTGPPLPSAPRTGRGFIGNKPSRCNFLRASLRARRMASAFSLTLLSEGFS
jgi:hypothetical protein